MTINNLNTYIEQLWDWGFLNNCFKPTKIRVTDMDGLVERNGHFLLIEAKSLGKDIPIGQQILFNNLIKSDRWHVLILWGAPNSPEKLQLWGHHSAPKPTNETKVQKIVRRWFVWASRQPKKFN
jgi:hypothetical protein